MRISLKTAEKELLRLYPQESTLYADLWVRGLLAPTLKRPKIVKVYLGLRVVAYTYVYYDTLKGWQWAR